MVPGELNCPGSALTLSRGPYYLILGSNGDASATDGGDSEEVFGIYRSGSDFTGSDPLPACHP